MEPREPPEKNKSSAFHEFQHLATKYHDRSEAWSKSSHSMSL